MCFFAGNLLLGATRSGALEQNVSVPPRPEQLSEVGRRDWATGIELLSTCVATHDTKTFVPPLAAGPFVVDRYCRGLAPEIAYFRIPSDNLNSVSELKDLDLPKDWYIKGAGYGPPHSGIETCFGCSSRSRHAHRVGKYPPYDARYMLRCVLIPLPPRLANGLTEHVQAGNSRVAVHRVPSHRRSALS